MSDIGISRRLSLFAIDPSLSSGVSGLGQPLHGEGKLIYIRLLFCLACGPDCSTCLRPLLSYSIGLCSVNGMYTSSFCSANSKKKAKQAIEMHCRFFTKTGEYLRLNAYR